MVSPRPPMPPVTRTTRCLLALMAVSFEGCRAPRRVCSMMRPAPGTLPARGLPGRPSARRHPLLHDLAQLPLEDLADRAERKVREHLEALGQLERRDALLPQEGDECGQV